MIHILAGLVEEFGQFKKLLLPGFNIINPCSEEVREIDLRIKLFSVGSHRFITKDNVEVAVQTSVAYRIVNPIKAYYVLGEQTDEALRELTAASMRTVIGEHILEEVITNRKRIVDGTRSLVKDGLPPGIGVESIFI